MTQMVLQRTTGVNIEDKDAEDEEDNEITMKFLIKDQMKVSFCI